MCSCGFAVWWIGGRLFSAGGCHYDNGVFILCCSGEEIVVVPGVVGVSPCLAPCGSSLVTHVGGCGSGGGRLTNSNSLDDFTGNCGCFKFRGAGSN